MISREIMALECECGRWKAHAKRPDGVGYLDAVRSGGLYDGGKKIVYCPWCGKRLQDQQQASIPGALDLRALARLHFHTLSHAEQSAAVRRLAVTGQTDYDISHATGWSVEAVRAVLTPKENRP